MLTRLLLFLLAVLMAGTASAAPKVLRDVRAASDLRHIITFDTTTDASELIPVRGLCVATFIRAGTETVTLYQTTASTATGGTSVATFSATTTAPTDLTYGQPNFYAVSDGATAGGSLTIHCSPLQVKGTGLTPSQESYAEGASVNGILANITDPSTTSFGMGITFGRHSPDSFDALPDEEADNMVGFFYNKTGVNGATINQYEHAFDDSWETAYRATAGTSDRTWVEKNLDIFLPDQTSTLTSINGSFNPAVAETVYFSGGGQGKVISWSSPTLVWRQDYGSTAAGETVIDDDGNPAHTAVVGAPSALGTHFRAFQLEYDTLLNRASWVWNTLSGDQTVAPHYEQDDLGAALRISPTDVNGRQKVSVGVNANPISNATFHVQDSATFGNTISLFEYDANTGTALDDLDGAVGTADGWGGGGFTLIGLEIDYGATNTAFGQPYGIRANTPAALGTSSTLTYPQVIRIDNQGGRGSNGGPAIHIMPQSCLNGGGFSTRCATDPGRFGNILMAGGNWNSGHLTFGQEGGIDSYEEVEDHLWRDQTNEVLRISTGDAPDSETDGRPFVTGTNSTAHGVSMWGISDAGSTALFDTGTEVCAAAGVALACQDVLEFSTPATPTDSACATAHADAVKFIAMCY